MVWVEWIGKTVVGAIVRKIVDAGMSGISRQLNKFLDLTCTWIPSWEGLRGGFVSNAIGRFTLHNLLPKSQESFIRNFE
jgi:hypothetical protein